MAKISFKFVIVITFFLFGCSHSEVSKTQSTEVGQAVNGTPVVETNQPETQIATPIPAAPGAPLVNKVLPRFGFIFSGGGAKAWAHIGVLKELQKMKWPVNGVAGFEWGSVVAAVYAENLSANEVEWEMSKLKDFEKTDMFLKSVFSKKSTAELKVPFVCPSLNLNKQSYFLLNRGLLDQLLPFCVSQPPLVAAHAQSVAVMSDVSSLAQYLRSTGANKIILVNVLSSQNSPRAFVKDFTSAENILWVQAAALMNKGPVGVDEIIRINLDDYNIKDLDRRRDLIAKGAELSYDQIKKLAAKYGL
jgi:predicted acylesterase/phospholipase RssA